MKQMMGLSSKNSANSLNINEIDDLDFFKFDRKTRKTKIVATLGPASKDKIRELILAGKYFIESLIINRYVN